MAEAVESVEKDITNLTNSIKGLKVHWVDSYPECSVCLQPCLQPVQLPCTHIFCFLCVKGFAYRSKKCALCRREVELDYFIDPVVVKIREVADKKSLDEFSTADTFQWFYEGRNGWWQYDERASLNLEDAFKTEVRSCEIIIAGFTYVVDFENMIQYRKNNPARCRRVKRDRSGADRKGVAGLQLKSVFTETCNECEKLFHKDEIYMNKCLQCTRVAPLVATEDAIGQNEGENEQSADAVTITPSEHSTHSEVSSENCSNIV